MRFKHSPPTDQCIPHRFVIVGAPPRSKPSHPFLAADDSNLVDSLFMEARAWCRAEFGREYATYEVDFERRWMSMGWSVYVYRADDAMAFKLRWC